MSFRSLRNAWFHRTMQGRLWCGTPGVRSLTTYQLPLLLLLFMLLTEYPATVEGLSGGFRRRGPVFTYDPPNRVDFSNSTGTLVPCSADGMPTPSIQWVLVADGRPASDVPGIRHHRPDGSLVFSPFQAELYRSDVHSSVYRCIASNVVGSVASREVHVHALVESPYQVQVYDEFIVEGSTAVMRCHVPSDVEDYVTLTTWKEEPTGRHIQPSATLGGRYLTFPWLTLHIRNVGTEYSYRSFRCQTRNRLTGAVVESSAGRLVVTESRSESPPRITDSKPVVRARIGSTVALPCVAQGVPLPKYVWLHERTKESESNLVRGPRFTHLEGNLIIRDASSEDSGHYICIANSSMGEDRAHVQLILTASLSASISPSVQRAHIGQSWSVNCTVSGFPIHGIVWWKDAVQIDATSSDRIEIVGTDILRIRSVRREDRGMYQCLVFNDKESTQASVELLLEDGVPELMDSFVEQTLQPGDSVSLKCTAGGNPLPQIAWFLDDSSVPEDGHRVRTGDYVKSGVVVSFVNISRLKTEDSGNYKCVADNGVGQVSHEAMINIAGPPVLVRRRTGSNVTVVAGEVLVLRCPVAGYPLDNIYWERANIRLPYNHRQKSHDNGTLEVHHVERSTDQGPYTCVASNKEGQSAQATVFVRVQVKPVIEPFSFPKLLREGQRATAVCTVSSGDLPIRIRWLKDEHELPSDVRSSEVADYSSTLLFESLKLRHKGNYSCEATNEAGSTSHSATMVIHVPPRWVIEPTDVFVVRGKTIIVDCKTEGFPEPRMRWRKAEGNSPREFKPIVSSPHIKVFENGSLAIANARESDAGYYLCQATNGIGQGLSKVVNLKVNVAAHFRSKFTAEMVRKGHNTRLKCEALGDKPITVAWMKDKVAIKTQANHRYEMVETESREGVVSEIIIREADRRDSGLFSCIATNSYGRDDTNIQLIVQEPPSAPQEVRMVEASSRSVKLTWNAPAYNGNSPITQYTIHYKDENGKWHSRMNNVTVPGSETQGTVTSLRPFKVYLFRAIAENRIGRSEPTKPIEIRTDEEAPSAAPIKVRVLPVSSQSIKVTWRAPSSEQQNGVLKGYYVGYKAKGSGDSYIYKTLEIDRNKEHENSNKEECHITGLRRNTQYSIIVQAYNNKGAGPPSDEVYAQTLEHDPPTTPPLSVADRTTSSIRLAWEINYDTRNPVTGFILRYRPEGNIDWEEEESHVPGTQGWVDVRGLRCGSRYEFQLTSYNGAGNGEPSEILTTSTKGSKPVSPSKKTLLSTNATAASIDVHSWDDGGCPITHMLVRFKEQKESEWTILSEGPPPPPEIRRLEISGLVTGAWYQVQVSVVNSAGSTDVEHTFAALAPSLEVIVPPKTIVNRARESSSTFDIFSYLDLTIALPVIVSFVVIVIVLVAVCLVVRKKNSSDSSLYGTSPCAERKGSDTMDLAGTEKSMNGKRNSNPYPQPYATTNLSSSSTSGRRRREDLTDSGYNQLQEEPLYATVKRTPRPPRTDGHIYHCPGLMLESQKQNSKSSSIIVKMKDGESECRTPDCSKRPEDTRMTRNT